MKEAIKLYPLRCRVELLFYDLRIVPNLKKFYVTNPNADAMQLYAAAIVLPAFRIAQADIAQQVALPPEELAPQKASPLRCLALITLTEAGYLFEEMYEVNRGVKLRKPSWKKLPHTVFLCVISKSNDLPQIARSESSIQPNPTASRSPK